MLEIKKLIFLDYKILNFQIDKPGIYGLIGRNGSGKSTFFSILNKETKVKDSIINTNKIMYLSNLQSFDKNLKGIDYLKILSNTEYEKALEISNKFGANEFINKKIGKFSLGMLQQFSIIISLSIDADIIIFDEIYTGLDIKHQKIFFELLNTEKNKKILVLTSHYFEDLKKHCDITFFLNKNSIEVVEDFSKLESKIIGESK
ncbi:ATP-binding cassette domain-containing protein (plasmid) [Lactococcus lactis subsp. lactis]|uniref:ATP-binding cassette domain-containing protein n=1 Tax=Lactococcus lactis TaxID=1358 RepID=UPI002648A391|nr:ATP-binding cassette domain-containing protein [Lactococcus lactis]WKB50015.1 ATP-binding cassette domain-containing protein [Lactococcus lactis subsp. lactis]